MHVQAAIVARKQELVVEQQLLQAAVDAGVASGIDPLDQPDIPADIKASTGIQIACMQLHATSRNTAPDYATCQH